MKARGAMTIFGELIGAMYYDRDGNKITLQEWAERWADYPYRVLLQSRVGPNRYVCTMWEGIDHSCGQLVPPCVFLTDVFDGAPATGQRVRCLRTIPSVTEADALEAHMQLVAECEADLGTPLRL